MISFSAQLDNKNCPPGSVSEGMLGLCVTTRSLKPASQQLYLAEEIGSICVWEWETRSEEKRNANNQLSAWQAICFFIFNKYIILQHSEIKYDFVKDIMNDAQHMHVSIYIPRARRQCQEIYWFFISGFSTNRED